MPDYRRVRPEDIFGQEQYQNIHINQEPTQKVPNKMWKLTVFNGDKLVLDHRQDDFRKVLAFAHNSLGELGQRGVADYRLVMQDEEGNVYFYAIGEKTQIIGLRKKGTPV